MMTRTNVAHVSPELWSMLTKLIEARSIFHGEYLNSIPQSFKAHLGALNEAIDTLSQCQFLIGVLIQEHLGAEIKLNQNQNG